jgi:hypothetical protein
MFPKLASWLAAGPLPTEASANQALGFHPLQITRFVEEMWAQTSHDPAIVPWGDEPTALLGVLPSGMVPAAVLAVAAPPAPQPPRPGWTNGYIWDHLIYAYMIENTRIYEIFERVLQEYLFGERLEVPSTAGRQWLRTTESLFYRDQSPASIAALTSWVRSDLRAARRNAYYRMFGLDLNHGTVANQPHPYVKPSAANRGFVPTFEDLLREVWLGIENAQNTSGIKATDDDAIANLCRQINDMMLVRRRGGNLAREEFVFVAMMSWFHLTVLFDTAIVRDLKAEADSPAERLRKIGERVGLPAHSKADSYFNLAEPVSHVLINIEQDLFSTPAAAPALYSPLAPASLRQDMMRIITHWSIATGRDIKAQRVAASPRFSQSAPRSSAVAPTGRTNGRALVTPGPARET